MRALSASVLRERSNEPQKTVSRLPDVGAQLEQYDWTGRRIQRWECFRGRRDKQSAARRYSAHSTQNRRLRPESPLEPKYGSRLLPPCQLPPQLCNDVGGLPAHCAGRSRSCSRGGHAPPRAPITIVLAATIRLLGRGARGAHPRRIGCVSVVPGSVTLGSSLEGIKRPPGPVVKLMITSVLLARI